MGEENKPTCDHPPRCVVDVTSMLDVGAGIRRFLCAQCDMWQEKMPLFALKTMKGGGVAKVISKGKL